MLVGKKNFFIPEICRNSNILSLLIIGQLLSFVANILLYRPDFASNLGMVSLYVHWIALSFFGLLCILREQLMKLSFWFGATCSFCIGVLCFLITEVSSQSLFLFSNLSFDWSRLYSFGLVAAILISASLWSFQFPSKLNSRIRAESEARVQALQAKIQPHFLFNSLNTISELTVTQPDKAEKAIEALSMLFRVSLEEDGALHSLEKEIRLCERYIELEMWRCSDRVNITWDISIHDIGQWLVPKLVLQPLLENAIKYGAEIIEYNQKSEISVSIKEGPNYLSIKLENPTIKQSNIVYGNGIALKNIKERLFVLYDDQQSFTVRNNSKYFQVLISIPKKAV